MRNMTRKINKIGSTNGHQSGNVYHSNGLCPALCCTDYKAPLKIIVDGGGTLDKDKVIKDNFREFSDGKFVTTERERMFMRLQLAHAAALYRRNKIIMYLKKRLLGFVNLQRKVIRKRRLVMVWS